MHIPSKKENTIFNKGLIKEKYKEYDGRIKHLMKKGDAMATKKLLNELHTFRQSGLNRKGKLSEENIVFSILKASGVIDKLKNGMAMSYNKKMDVNENTTNDEPTELQKAFNVVHIQQRFEGPENMFDPRYNPNVNLVSGLWQNALEHVGDIIHRLSYSGYNDFGGGGAEYGKDAALNKIDRWYNMLRREPDAGQWIKSNYEYRIKNKEFDGSLEDYTKLAKQAGERYSKEYEKIRPVTQVQKLAKEAAVALGRFQIFTTMDKLKKIEQLLSGPDWERNYWMPLPETGLKYNDFEKIR